MWVCFLQLFDPSTPKASNCDPTAREYFTRNHSYKNSFKQCKISYNLIKFCCIWKFKVSTYFSQSSTFLKFQKPIWLRIPRGLWPYDFFEDFFILRGQNHKIITHGMVTWWQILIWGQTMPWIKKFKNIDSHFKDKNGCMFSSCFWSEHS